MKTESYSCDVKDCNNPADHKGVSIQVIFHTEQTEGRNVAPYLSSEKMDICTSCKNKILEGNYLHGWGAMGHNEFRFAATVTKERKEYMRKQATTVIELTKGFEGEPTDNAMKTALEMTNYVLELTNH